MSIKRDLRIASEKLVMASDDLRDLILAMPDDAPPTPTPRATVIPWVELNWWDAFKEDVVKGCLEWRGVAEQIIVTTRPGYADKYDKLYDEVVRHDIELLPGLKTSGFCDPFDDVDVWKRLAGEIGALRKATGGTRFILENEMALKPYVMGYEEINFTRLITCLEQLPKDLEYLWFPPHGWRTGGDPGVQRLHDLNLLVHGVPDLNVSFFSQRHEKRGLHKNGLQGVYEKQLRDMQAGGVSPTMLYFGKVKGKFTHWPYDRVVEAVETCAESGFTEAIIYPGVKHWPEASRALAGLLRGGG